MSDTPITDTLIDRCQSPLGGLSPGPAAALIAICRILERELPKAKREIERAAEVAHQHYQPQIDDDIARINALESDNAKLRELLTISLLYISESAHVLRSRIEAALGK